MRNLRIELLALLHRLRRWGTLLPRKRIAAVPFFFAGAAACISSGLGVFMDASAESCIAAFLVGLVYNGVGFLFWTME